MTDIDTTGAQSRTLTAFFDARGAADRAVADLEAAGIPRRNIRRLDGSTPGSAPSASGAESETGFWASLKEMFMPEEDRQGYGEGLRRGGFVIAVTADEARYQRAIDILDRDGAVDMDEREASWRKEGWTGYEAGGGAGFGAAMAAATPVAPGAMERDERAVPASQVRSVGGETAASAGGTAATSVTTSSSKAGRSPEAMERAAERSEGVAAPALAAGAEEIVPVYEEQLRVGKRDVSHGRVRLRSYVVETPVEERVDLRRERVAVERRPVDRPATGLTGDVFAERVIEVEERAEEAVISKDVRLKEEVALRKEAEQHTETVSDTVRRTEVEVEDGRGRDVAPAAAGVVGGAAAGAASTLAGQIREHMDVVALGGAKVGTVDHLQDDGRIKLTRTASPDGQHHFIPLTWVERVDRHVHLNKGPDVVMAGW